VGTKPSPQCSLTCLLLPTLIREKLTNVQAVMGSVVMMECKVAGSLPLSVEWSKGKQKITKSSKYKPLHIDNTISLELKLTESTDTGEYSCRVTNKAGNCVCSGVLTAKVPPSFVAEPESQAVTPKSTVLFRSVFEGTPPFAIKWFKGDMELITGPSCTIRLEKYSSSVELYSVGTLQCGIYSCHISNDAGAVKSAAELLVKGWTILFFVHPPPFVSVTNLITVLQCVRSHESEWYLFSRHVFAFFYVMAFSLSSNSLPMFISLDST
uniref:Ig-like domain-containing protein n=1 Tax=Seriola lalandi dorsalis TaxID=1841481 RepID=A0A3B4WQV7_SERLL